MGRKVVRVRNINKQRLRMKNRLRWIVLILRIIFHRVARAKVQKIKRTKKRKRRMKRRVKNGKRKLNFDKRPKRQKLHRFVFQKAEVTKGQCPRLQRLECHQRLSIHRRDMDEIIGEMRV